MLGFERLTMLPEREGILSVWAVASANRLVMAAMVKDFMLLMTSCLMSGWKWKLGN